MVEDDKYWLFHLMNDSEVYRYIEGVDIFNQNIESTSRFIKLLNKSSKNSLGHIWAIEYRNMAIGFIFVYDIGYAPFLCFAINKEFRRMKFATEVVSFINEYLIKNRIAPDIESKNPIVMRVKEHIESFSPIGD
jgi:RimJ/RimL family protein N-acetyltransferase